MSLDDTSESTAPIRLDDRTAPAPKDRDLDPPTPTSPTAAESLLHRPRGDTIRKELTRLKYARFQEGRYDADDDGSPSRPGSSTQTPEPASKHIRHASGSIGATLAKVEPHRRSVFRPKQDPRALKKEKEEYAVDILYENQRGWFFCGIPLYSANSLLNFDPAPWQTPATDNEGSPHDSPVNITNAQVPDPTWAWAWPSWYVDMSHDVDEEGWAYAATFRAAWHGAAPWWTSFVRRRRWLRKRIRTHAAHAHRDALGKAHQMNPDYFTIHGVTDRDSSRGSSRERTVRPTSISGNHALAGEAPSETSDSDDEMSDVAALLARLKRTTVDRKKLDALRQFVAHGGAELAYLPGALPEIMSLFMYQHSRRAALDALEAAQHAAQREASQASRASGAPAAASTAPSAATSPRNTAPQRAADLRAAIAAVSVQVHGRDYVDMHHPLSPAYPSPLVPYAVHSAATDDDGGDGGWGNREHGKEPRPQHDDQGDTASIYGTDTASVYGDQETMAAELAASPTRAVGQGGAFIKGIPEAAHVGEEVGLAARMEGLGQGQDEGE